MYRCIPCHTLLGLGTLICLSAAGMHRFPINLLTTLHHKVWLAIQRAKLHLLRLPLYVFPDFNTMSNSKPSGRMHTMA